MSRAVGSGCISNNQTGVIDSPSCRKIAAEGSQVDHYAAGENKSVSFASRGRRFANHHSRIVYRKRTGVGAAERSKINDGPVCPYYCVLLESQVNSIACNNSTLIYRRRRTRSATQIAEVGYRPVLEQEGLLTAVAGCQRIASDLARIINGNRDTGAPAKRSQIKQVSSIIRKCMKGKRVNVGIAHYQARVVDRQAFAQIPAEGSDIN